MSEETRAMYQARVLKLENELKHIKDCVFKAASGIASDIETLQKECGKPAEGKVEYQWADIRYRAAFIQEVLK